VPNVERPAGKYHWLHFIDYSMIGIDRVAAFSAAVDEVP